MEKEMELKNTEEKKLLTISLLVSNRKDTIRKCMDSIKPLLDAIPSELIAVDTGGTDGSIDIVREYTDQIVPFVWCNDFSVARNAGLERAQGEWFLYLDDDEWFEDVTEIINFFQSGEYKEYDCAWYIVRNYMNEKGTAYKEGRVFRVCKRTAGLQFVGKVHERFSQSGSRIKIFSCYVHHYGYVYKSEEEMQKHSERNVSLLLQEVQDNPDDVRMLAQLVQEYRAVRRFDEAMELCEKALIQFKDNYLDPFVQYFITCQPAIARLQKDEQKTEQMVQKVRKKYPVSNMALLGCMVECVLAAENVNNEQSIFKKIPAYFAIYDIVKAQDERYGEVMDFAFYTSDEIYLHIMQLGYDTCCSLKQYDLFKDLMARTLNLPAEFLTKQRLEATLVYLIKCYLEGNRGDIFFACYESFLDIPKVQEKACQHMELLWRKLSNKRIELAAGVESWHRTEPLFLLMHMFYCMQNGEKEEISEAVKNYFSFAKGKYDEYVITLCLTMPVYGEIVLHYVDFSAFQQGVALCLKEKLCDIEQILKQEEPVWSKAYLLYWYYAKIVFGEKEILQTEKVSTRMLLDYVQTVLKYASLYYSEEMFVEGNRRWLPRNCQFALYVKEAFEAKEQSNHGRWTEYMKQAAKVYPPMIAVLQSVLKEEAKKVATQQITPEMQQLAEDLKKNIRELMKTGQKAAAKELVVALEQYVPGDKEISILRTLLEKGI